MISGFSLSSCSVFFWWVRFLKYSPFSRALGGQLIQISVHFPSSFFYRCGPLFFLLRTGLFFVMEKRKFELNTLPCLTCFLTLSSSCSFLFLHEFFVKITLSFWNFVKLGFLAWSLNFIVSRKHNFWPFKRCETRFFGVNETEQLDYVVISLKSDCWHCNHCLVLYALDRPNWRDLMRRQTALEEC